MGSFGGTCEIVESNEEMDLVQLSRGANQPCSGLGMDEKVGKLPMLKTGRNGSDADDLNRIFEAIDRRNAARGLGFAHQSDTGMPSKNASKKPIRVGISQASGIGVSESVSLKQALRGLCISHASEMAAMKRLSKPVGSPGVSESGALNRLYRAVVVETGEAGLPLHEGEGSLVQISIVPEKSVSNSDEITASKPVSKANSRTASAHSSPRYMGITNKKVVTTNTELQDEIVPASKEIRGKTSMHKPSKKANLKLAPSLYNAVSMENVLEQHEIVPVSTEVGRKKSILEQVKQGPRALSSSRHASKVSKSASTSPRVVNPVVTCSTAVRPTSARTPPPHGIVLESTSFDVQTVGKVSKSASNSPRMVSKSASNSPRLVKPLSMAHSKRTTTRTQLQSEIAALESTSVAMGTACTVSKSASNSPRMPKQVSITQVMRPRPPTSRTQHPDDLAFESAELGGKVSMLKLTQKGKLKSAPSNTIKEVLEVEDFDPSSKAGELKASAIKLEVKSELYSATSSSGSNTTTQASKSASNSPRVTKQIFRHKSFVKKKVKQDSTPTSSGSVACNGVDNEDMSHTKNNLVCQTHCHQKSIKKKSASPASSSTSVEVSSSNMLSSSNKGGINSSNCNDRAVVAKTGERSTLGDKGEISQSSKSSIGEYSSSTSFSEESNLSGSNSGNRPHMSKDLRWDAIHHVQMRYGSLGLRNFKLLKRLGCGDIGTVYLAEISGTNCLFALKVMDNEYLASRKKMPRAQTEREILQMLDHPFLPTLYAHFTTDKFSCLVMEFCPGGDLHVLRQRQPNRSFSEQAARFYVAEVLLALEYLHMLGVVYRDLKPENILVREDGHIMLSDFDLSLRCSVSPTLLTSSSAIMEPAKKLSGPCAESSCIDPFCLQPSWAPVSCFSPRIISATKARKLKADIATQVTPLPQLVAEPTSARSNSFVGTHEYLAPEIIKGEGHGSAVDWWTYGIFLYELLFGKTPFKGSGNEDTLANVVLLSLKFPESPSVSFEARDLIRGLLVKEPDNRLGSVKGATEIKQHPFFEGLNWALIRCAIPPELPKSYDSGEISVACQTETKSPEFKDSGEHLEFELF